MIIQNLDTLFLKVTSETKEIFLPKERFLDDRNVNFFIPCFQKNGSTDGIHTFNGVNILEDTYRDHIYIDVYEKGKDYKTKNLNLTFIDSENNNRFKFDTILDFDLSVIKLKSSPQTNSYLPVCAIYTDEANNIATPTCNSLTLVAPAGNAGKIKLVDIGGYQLNGQLIKKIESLNSEDVFLTIRTKNNENNINDMPLYLLDNGRQFGDNNIYFDSLWIDWDNSYLTVTQNKATDTILTFKF